MVNDMTRVTLIENGIIAETAELKNAIIKDVRVMIEDHGLLSCYVTLDYGGSCQGFGGYELYNPHFRYTSKNNAGLWFFRLMETVGVYNLEELQGKAVRAYADNSKVYGIGHIVKDEWFFPQEEFQALYPPEQS